MLLLLLTGNKVAAEEGCRGATGVSDGMVPGREGPSRLCGSSVGACDRPAGYHIHFNACMPPSSDAAGVAYFRKL